MPPVGIEPTVSAGERPQTYALDFAATGTGHYYSVLYINISNYWLVYTYTYLSLCAVILPHLSNYLLQRT